MAVQSGHIERASSFLENSQKEVIRSLKSFRSMRSLAALAGLSSRRRIDSSTSTVSKKSSFEGKIEEEEEEDVVPLSDLGDIQMEIELARNPLHSEDLFIRQPSAAALELCSRQGRGRSHGSRSGSSTRTRERVQERSLHGKR